MAEPSQSRGSEPRADARREAPPGEDPGTLTDEEYLSAGGPDALDSATPSAQERGVEAAGDDIDAHPDSAPASKRVSAGEDPERAGRGRES